MATNESVETSVKPTGFLGHIIRLVEGFLLGCFSILPFSNVRDLKETMLVDDVPEGESLPKKISHRYQVNWSLILGSLIGVFFVFLIPFSFLSENFPLGLHGGMLAFAVVFLALEILRLYQANDRKHLVSSLIFLVVGVLLMFALYKIDFTFAKTVSSGAGEACLFILILIGSLVTSFSGESLGTLLYMSGLFLSVATSLNSLDYLQGIKSNLVLIAAVAIGYLGGDFLGYYLRARDDFKMERSSLNIGISLFGIFYLSLTQFKAPLFVGYSSSLQAEWVTDATMIIGSFAMAVALVAHGFVKPEKTKPMVLKDPLPLPVETPKPESAQHQSLTRGLLSGKEESYPDDDTLEADIFGTPGKESVEPNTAPIQQPEETSKPSEKAKPAAATAEPSKPASDSQGGLDIAALKSLYKSKGKNTK